MVEGFKWVGFGLRYRRRGRGEGWQEVVTVEHPRMGFSSGAAVRRADFERLPVTAAAATPTASTQPQQHPVLPYRPSPHTQHPHASPCTSSRFSSRSSRSPRWPAPSSSPASCPVRPTSPSPAKQPAAPSLSPAGSSLTAAPNLAILQSMMATRFVSSSPAPQAAACRRPAQVDNPRGRP
jgi:hypothetical protein